MSFEAYLKDWLGNYQQLNEANKPTSSKPNEFDEITNIIRSGIGGETDNKIAKTTSFESIEQVLQKIDISLLEKVKANPDLQKVLLSFVSPGKVEWLAEYLTKSKKTLNAISADKKKIDPSSNFDAYTRLTLREADIKNRIYKLYVIFKYAEEAPELDKDTNILAALKQIGEPLISSTDQNSSRIKISKIGRIDNLVGSDEFEVTDDTGAPKILKKEELKNILELNPEIAKRASDLANNSYKKKVSKLVQRTEDTIKKEVASALNNTAQAITDLPNTISSMEKLQVDWKPLIDALGYSKFFTNTIKQKEKVLTRDERPSLRKKNRIKEKLMGALRSALLPPIVNGEISEPGGDYYKLFKRLESQNGAWLDASIKETIVDENRIAQFNASARSAESPLEENQLAYLQIGGAWIMKYIQSEVDGELSKRDMDNAVTKIKSVIQEKEKEIKNYYLSKDFNMENFEGIQLKPNLRLPLYQRVKLAVSEADKIAESPLKNLFKGLGQIAVGLFSNIPDRGDAALAAKNAERNRAIFNGIFSIIKGGVYGVNKQAGRSLEKGVSNVTNKLRLDVVGLTPYEKGEGPSFYKSAEKKTNEQDTGGVSPGADFQTPASLPDNTMDTFALAGPGKKEKPKKKKSMVTKVASFSDFLKNKG